MVRFPQEAAAGNTRSGMTGGQIAALIFAILLFFPGGCFLVVGISFFGEGSGWYGLAIFMLVIAALILSLVGLLGWLALRRRSPPAAGGPV